MPAQTGKILDAIHRVQSWAEYCNRNQTIALQNKNTREMLHYRSMKIAYNNVIDMLEGLK